MSVKRADARTIEVADCHGGKGKLTCTELFTDYAKKGTGFTFVHDDILEPGASVGEHTHRGSEEIYFIVEGRGTAIIDGKHHKIGPGEMLMVRDGHSHGLINGLDAPMRILVICTNV